MILDCFPVFKSKDFEIFLNAHSEIKPNIIKNFKNHEKENGLFLIGKKLSFKRLIQIINQNINNYYDDRIELIEKPKVESNIIDYENDYNIKELIEQNKKLYDNISKLENSQNQIIEKINQLTKK
jgi:hypothetical protein